MDTFILMIIVVLLMLVTIGPYFIDWVFSLSWKFKKGTQTMNDKTTMLFLMFLSLAFAISALVLLFYKILT